MPIQSAHRPLAVASLASCLIASAVFAQTPEKGAATTPAPAKSAAANTQGYPTGNQLPSDSGPIITINFRAGTLTSYVALVRDAAKEPVNVLVPASASELPVPAISLQNVSVRTALESLKWAFSDSGPDRVSIQSINRDSGGAPTFAVQHAKAYAGGPMQPGMNAFGETPQRVEVFSVRDLVTAPADGKAALSMETAISTVEAALKMDSEKSPVAELMVHKDSGVLIVRGTNRQIDTARSVLQQLMVDAKRTIEESKAKRAYDTVLRELQMEHELAVKRSRSALDMLTNRMRATETDTARVQELVKAGGATSQDLLRMQSQLEMLRTEAARYQQDIEAAEAEKAILPERAAAKVSHPNDDLARQVKELQETVRSLTDEVRQLKSQRGGR